MAETRIEERSSLTTHPDRLLVHPIARWHADHSNFARVLDLVEQQVDAMHEGKRPDYELMRSIVYYLRHYPDRFHHPREDVAFARMAQRDPRLQLEMARRMQEHVVIAATGETLLKFLDDIIAGVVIDGPALEAAAATYLVYYRHHLDAEDRQVIPRAMELLTSEDWRAVAAIPTELDPLFGVDVDARYSELRKRIAREPEQAEG